LILANPEGKYGDDVGGERALVEYVPTENMLRISVRGGKNPSKVGVEFLFALSLSNSP
jgi:hypothetical protein